MSTAFLCDLIAGRRYIKKYRGTVVRLHYIVLKLKGAGVYDVEKFISVSLEFDEEGYLCNDLKRYMEYGRRHVEMCYSRHVFKKEITLLFPFVFDGNYIKKYFSPLFPGEFKFIQRIAVIRGSAKLPRYGGRFAGAVLENKQ